MAWSKAHPFVLSANLHGGKVSLILLQLHFTIKCFLYSTECVTPYSLSCIVLLAGSLVANYPYDGIHRGLDKHHAAYSRAPDDITFRHLAEAFSWVSRH